MASFKDTNWTLRSIVHLVTRVLLSIYAVLAYVSISPALGLLSSKTVVDNDVFTIPLQVCMPSDISSVTADATSMNAEYDGSSVKCKGVGLLVFATIASLSISGFASLIYVYKDVRKIERKGTMNLIFILLQTVLTLSALAREASFWQDAYQDLMSSSGYKVRLHGSTIVLSLTRGVLYLTIVVLCIRKFFTTCRPESGDANTGSTKPIETPDDVATDGVEVVIPAGETQQKSFKPTWSSNN
jgi:hypothetical protein